MKKSIWIYILALVLGLLLFLVSCGTSKNGYYIFSEIQELENMELQFEEYGEVDRYNDTSKDKNIKEMQYDRFYGAYYKCEDFEFEIFAYEFSNIYNAKKYFQNVTGKECKTTVNFGTTSGMSQKTQMIVINQENAYLILFENEFAKEIENFLSENFALHLVYDEELGWTVEKTVN